MNVKEKVTWIKINSEIIFVQFTLFQYNDTFNKSVKFALLIKNYKSNENQTNQ